MYFLLQILFSPKYISKKKIKTFSPRRFDIIFAFSKPCTMYIQLNNKGS